MGIIKSLTPTRIEEDKLAPKSARDFFPAKVIAFNLETAVGQVRVRVFLAFWQGV